MDATYLSAPSTCDTTHTLLNADRNQPRVRLGAIDMDPRANGTPVGITMPPRASLSNGVSGTPRAIRNGRVGALEQVRSLGVFTSTPAVSGKSWPSADAAASDCSRTSHVWPMGAQTACCSSMSTDLIVDKVLKALTIFIPSLMLALVLLYDVAGSPLHCLVPSNYSTAAGFSFVNSFCLTWLVGAASLRPPDAAAASDATTASPGFLLHRFVACFLLLQIALMSLPYFVWYLGMRRHLASLLWTIQREYDRFFASLLREVTAWVENGVPLCALTGSCSLMTKSSPSVTVDESAARLLCRRRVCDCPLTRDIDTGDVLKQLPRLRTCQSSDWLLNSYVIQWQRSQQLRNRYLLKHFFSALFHLLGFLLPLAALSTNQQGGHLGFYILAENFYCLLKPEFGIYPSRVFCTFPNTVFLNGILVACMLINALALVLQMWFLCGYTYCCSCYRKFPSAFLRENFFGSYITLIAYARHNQKFHLENIEHLYVTVNPRLIQTDFLLISKLCDANVDRFYSHYAMKHWVFDKFLVATGREVLDLKNSCYLVDKVALDFDLIKLHA